MVLDIKKIIKKRIQPFLTYSRNYTTKYEMPSLKTIVINTNLGTELGKSEKFFEKSTEILYLITMQGPKVVKAKKSVSNFKLREGDPVALVCNLHYLKMFRFLTNLLFFSLPQVEDWFINTKKLDDNYNLNIGIDEHLIFPEIGFAFSGKPFGLNININFKNIKNKIDNSFFLKLIMLA